MARALSLFILLLAFSVPIFAMTDITTANLTTTFVGESAIGSPRFGNGLVRLGDINGDGIDDFGIGAPGNDSVTNNAGKFYIFLGPITPGVTIDAAAASGSFRGSNSFLYLGLNLFGDFDFNGDGKRDWMMGTPESSRTYFQYGKAEAWTPSASVTGVSTIFYSVKNFGNDSSAGDVNGDGYDDCLIASYKAGTAPYANAGDVFLYMGPTMPSNLNTTDAATLSRAIFRGESGNDLAGTSIAVLPDINDDGYDDIAISSPVADQERGKVYLFYGKSAGFSGVISLVNADAVIQGAYAGGHVGVQVRGIGDINGDGIGDWAIAADSNGTALLPSVFVFLGGASRLASVNAIASADAVLTTDTDTQLQIGTCGDINGDLLSDLFISDSAYNSMAGRGEIFWGKSSGVNSWQLNSPDVRILGQGAGELGASFGALGAIYGDSVDAIGVGIPGLSDGVNQAVGILGIVRGMINTGPASISAISVVTTGNSPVSTLNTMTDIVVRLTGDTGDLSTRNITVVTVGSGSLPSQSIRLRETSAASGIYEGILHLRPTRTSKYLNQVRAIKGEVVSFSSATTPATSTQLSVQNSLPQLSAIQVTQVGSGSSAKVRIDYRLVDSDRDTCNFSTVTQVQFSSDGLNWTDASTSGSTSQLLASPTGVLHTETNQPLYWNAGQRNGNFQVRLAVNDGSGTSDYVVSPVIAIDTTPPTAPTLDTQPVHHIYSITVSGNAESGSTVFIYADTQLVSTVSVASGRFLGTGIIIPPTATQLSAVAIDAAGNVSATSNTQPLVFMAKSTTITRAQFSADVTIPVGGTIVEVTPTASYISTGSIGSLAALPSSALPVFGVSVGFLEDPSNSGVLMATMSITLHPTTPISDTSRLSIYRLSNGNWVSTGIRITTCDATSISIDTQLAGTYAIVQLTDTTPPTVIFQVNGTPLKSDTIVATTPEFTVNISDLESKISTWRVGIQTSTGTTLPSQVTPSVWVPAMATTISVSPNSPLSDGRYIIFATASDEFGNSVTVNSVVFTVDSQHLAFTMTVGPNPVRTFDPVTIEYTLSIPSTVRFRIVNIRGEIVDRWEVAANSADGLAGTHQRLWTGQTASGFCPNGVYIVYGVAETGGTSIRKKFKIALIR